MLSHFHPARPYHGISVLLKSGLTNFSGCTVLAVQLASKENGEALMNATESYKQQMNKFSAGIFCFFLMPKRKSPSAAVSRGKTAP